MIVDIHKPDTSTLVTTGHFYFGWTLEQGRVVKHAGRGYPSGHFQACLPADSLFAQWTDLSGKESMMHISIRKYKLNAHDAKTRSELTRLINDMFLPEISKAPGLVGLRSRFR